MKDYMTYVPQFQKELILKMNLDELAEIESLIADRKNDLSRESESNFRRNQKYREKSKREFESLAPKLEKWLLENLKAGSIIRCKAYKREKKVLEVSPDSVLALCGSYRKGKFESDIYSSSTWLRYVTEILVNGKFVKVKELMKQGPLA